MNDLLKQEAEKAERELNRIQIVREWTRQPRKYDINSIRQEGQIRWECFGNDKTPLIGIEQICEDNGIYTNTLRFHAFFLAFMLSARDIPEDMTIRIGVGLWNYARFMRKHYIFAEQYRKSFHYMFDQMKDDYLLLLRDERRLDQRVYAKVYPDGTARIVKLRNEKTSIEQVNIPGQIFTEILEGAGEVVTKGLLQELRSEDGMPEACIMLKYGLNMWNMGDPRKGCPNEYINGRSRYPYINKLLLMKEFSIFANTEF